MPQTIEEQVIDIVAEQLGVEKGTITAKSTFIGDLGADSLDTVELVIEFEDEFDIEISGADAEGITTVGQAVDVVTKLVAQAQAISGTPES